MKILRLRVDGFGPLRGEWSFSADKLNLVVDGNERGKSSLLAAIHAALYGLDDDAARIARSRRSSAGGPGKAAATASSWSSSTMASAGASSATSNAAPCTCGMAAATT